MTALQLPDGRWFVRVDGAGPVIVPTEAQTEAAEKRLRAKVGRRNEARVAHLLGDNEEGEE